MKTTTVYTKMVLLTYLFMTSMASFSQTTATYDITFTSVWNATDHGTLPGNAHWSKLVGANHNSNRTFLQMGQTASAGIEDIAEQGDNDIFKDNEVIPTIPLDTQQYINGNSLGSATGRIMINDLEISEDFPLLTLVSMIAPSPDWMIAVNSINLRNGGSWKPSITIDLFPYDAGTDNGVNYTSSDSNNTGGTITSLVNIGPFSDQKIGTLVITLKSVLALNHLNFGENIKIYPNPSNGIITVDNLSGNFITSLHIYDVAGNVVKNTVINSKLKTSPITLQNLSSGIYFIKISSDVGLTSTKKIIVE